MKQDEHRKKVTENVCGRKIVKLDCTTNKNRKKGPVIAILQNKTKNENSIEIKYRI